MANIQYSRSTKESRIRRAEGGDYVKQLRVAAGLTQKDLAEALNLKYYTFISQLENGQGRLPPNLYVKTAKALGVDTKEFALAMLEFYDPHTHAAITTQTEWLEEND
jgi:transcriptional regulator with XRE-family HTH domain